ncbi:MAG: cyclin-dependent kinase inhibitor 3 family protein [Polyangiaceae bacterium]
MFTSDSHPIRVDFIDPTHHGLPGRLGLTIAPGKQDDRWRRDLETDLKRLREEYKTGLLVSLMEGHEYAALRIEELFERAEQLGIEVARFQIRDVSVPPAGAMPKFAELIGGVVAAMREGRTVVVHCRGGLGRSGVVAACALTALGVEPSQAIMHVREARPGAVETRAQEAWVSSFRASRGVTGAT